MRGGTTLLAVVWASTVNSLSNADDAPGLDRANSRTLSQATPAPMSQVHLDRPQFVLVATQNALVQWPSRPKAFQGGG